MKRAAESINGKRCPCTYSCLEAKFDTRLIDGPGKRVLRTWISLTHQILPPTFSARFVCAINTTRRVVCRRKAWKRRYINHKSLELRSPSAWPNGPSVCDRRPRIARLVRERREEAQSRRCCQQEARAQRKRRARQWIKQPRRAAIKYKQAWT